MSLTHKHYSETVILFIDRNAWRNKDFGHIFDRFNNSILSYFCYAFARVRLLMPFGHLLDKC